MNSSQVRNWLVSLTAVVVTIAFLPLAKNSVVSLINPQKATAETLVQTAPLPTPATMPTPVPDGNTDIETNETNVIEEVVDVLKDATVEAQPTKPGDDANALLLMGSKGYLVWNETVGSEEYVQSVNGQPALAPGKYLRTTTADDDDVSVVYQAMK